MRFISIALLAILLSGCAAKKAAGPEATFVEGKTRAQPVPASRSSRGNPASKSTVTRDEGSYGKVVLVNPVLRFVVMDFPVLRMPAVDQRLNVYHNGQKVGEVKVTGPRRDTTIAGDIMAGEAQAGDDVRED